MLVRYYMLVLVPTLATIILARFVPAPIITQVNASIGGSLGLRGSALHASGPAALFFGLLLIGPRFYPVTPRDHLEKLRKKLQGKWKLVAWNANNDIVNGTAAISINKTTRRLFIEGVWYTPDGTEVKWRAQQIYLDTGRLSYIVGTDNPMSNDRSKEVRSVVDFNIQNQPTFRILSGRWHSIESKGSNRIDLTR